MGQWRCLQWAWEGGEVARLREGRARTQSSNEEELVRASKKMVLLDNILPKLKKTG